MWRLNYILCLTGTYATDRRAKLRLKKKFGSFRMGLTAMHYQLSFLDETGCVRDRRESDFEADSTALLWMRIVGAERALDLGWSMMELCSRRRCVARVPAHVVRRAWKSHWHPGRDLCTDIQRMTALKRMMQLRLQLFNDFGNAKSST